MSDGFFSNLASGIGDFLSSPVAPVVGAVGESLLANRGISQVGETRERVLQALSGQPGFPQYEGGLLGEVGRQAQFKPFTVTGPFGAGATVSQTGTELALSPQQAALQEQLTGFGQQAFGMLGDPAQREAEQTALIGMLTQTPEQRAGREAELFSRLEALQAPERERARLGLEERLFSQGRTGVRTSMFGGTPEQLALEKAIQEQQAGSALSAIEQARQEQALQSQQTLAGLGEARARLGLLGELGLSAIPTAFAGQEALIRSLQPQLEASRIASALQAGGLETGAQLALGGLEADVQLSDLERALRQQQYQGLFDLLSSGMRQQQGQPSIDVGDINIDALRASLGI